MTAVDRRCRQSCGGNTALQDRPELGSEREFVEDVPRASNIDRQHQIMEIIARVLLKQTHSEARRQLGFCRGNVVGDDEMPAHRCIHRLLRDRGSLHTSQIDTLRRTSKLKLNTPRSEEVGAE